MFSVHCVRMKQALSPLRSQCRLYSGGSYFSRTVNFLFKKNLLLTNSITSGAFMGIGDLVIQEFEYRSKLIPKRYDWVRAAVLSLILISSRHPTAEDTKNMLETGRMFIVGVLLGPPHHYYYLYLDKFWPKSDYKTVLKKLAADQAFASPLFILFFFYGMGILERKSLQQCTDETMSKFKYTYVGDWLFWPPVQWVNFYYLPTQYRVFYINIATMVFDVFLSYMKHFDQH